MESSHSFRSLHHWPHFVRIAFSSSTAEVANTPTAGFLRCWASISPSKCPCHILSVMYSLQASQIVRLPTAGQIEFRAWYCWCYCWYTISFVYVHDTTLAILLFHTAILTTAVLGAWDLLHATPAVYLIRSCGILPYPKRRCRLGRRRPCGALVFQM